MNSKLLTASLIVTAALVGCSKKDHTIVGESIAEKNTPKVAPIDPASLPPAIAATKTYRCKDNSVLSVDWLADKMTANIHPTKGAAPVQVKTAEAGSPMIADGYSLTGTATGSTITLAMPGKGSQSCKA